jgi:hypothetical protein
MQLGKSLVGAIIGGLVGAALCVAIVKLSGGWDKMWLAIPVALLTGLGVRWMANTKGHPSYARGALTAIIAVGAYFLSFWITTLVMTQGAAAMPTTGLTAARPADNGAADDANAADTATEMAADETPAAPTRSADTQEGGSPAASLARSPRQQQWSLWDIAALVLAALVAYQLGRGSDGPRTTVAGSTVVRDDEPAPAPGQFPPSD